MVSRLVGDDVYLVPRHGRIVERLLHFLRERYTNVLADPIALPFKNACNGRLEVIDRSVRLTWIPSRISEYALDLFHEPVDFDRPIENEVRHFS